MSTDEQQAADAAVREAIERAVRAYELIPPDATMVDFVVIVEGMRYHSDAVEVDERDEFRAVLYRDGVAHTSVALDLLDLARIMIRDPAIDP